MKKQLIKVQYCLYFHDVRHIFSDIERFPGSGGEGGVTLVNPAAKETRS